LQVLSRRDQRLIEKLSQTAVVTPISPVTGATLLGVVENLYARPPAATARVVTMQPQAAPVKPFRPPAWTTPVLSPDFSQRSKEEEMKRIFGTAKSRDVRDVPFRQWGALGVLAAACVTVIVASLHGIVPRPSLPRPTPAPVNNARTLPAPAPTPNRSKPAVALTPASVSLAAKPRHQLAPPPTEQVLAHNELASLENETGQPASVTRANIPPAPLRASVADTIVEQNPITHASTPRPLLVSELPQGHFVHPVVSEPNLVGELQLKALIGPDGLVKQVTVLSGNRKLAEAGLRAVRQWHYAPYEVLGSPVEVETHIKMNFFGEDAVSVASVSTGSPAGPRVASVPAPRDQPLGSKAND
jgi:Gram-negative bacterial TonB protein C-terminal